MRFPSSQCTRTFAFKPWGALPRPPVGLEKGIFSPFSYLPLRIFVCVGADGT